MGFHRIKMDFIFWCFTCIASLPMILAIEPDLKVEPVEIILLEGEPLTAMCYLALLEMREPLSKCEWNAAEPYNFLDVKPGVNLSEGIEYYGRGLEYGGCGIKIRNVTEKDDRPFTCRLVPQYGGYKRQRKGYIPVEVKSPRAPEITVTGINATHDIYPRLTFTENETIRAECRAEYGQAEANLFFFIETEPLVYELSPLVIEDPREKGWKTMRKNLTKTLQHSDNGRDIKCVAYYIAFNTQRIHFREAIFPLNVHFTPRLVGIEKRSFSFGQPGKFNVTILSNPRPTIEWLVDDEKIREGFNDSTGRFYAANLTEIDQAKWTAELQIDQIKFVDGRKNYTIIARNKVGELKQRIYLIGLDRLISPYLRLFTDFF